MICANVFDSKESIKEHLKSSHENTEHNENDYELVNEAFNCELCGRYFSYKHHLQHHVERYKNNKNEKMFNLACINIIVPNHLQVVPQYYDGYGSKITLFL